MAGEVNAVHDIEDVYPLTPTQAGILFESLQVDDNGPAPYFQQIGIGLRGRLHGERWIEAWQATVDAEPVLRSAMLWESCDRPVQIVSRHVRLPVTQHDWRPLTPDVRRLRWKALLADDRRRGFDLTRAPLLRLHLVRETETAWRQLWSHHHILLDGWSAALVFQAVLARYARLCGRMPNDRGIPASPRYRDFVAWLHKQDAGASASFWRARITRDHVATSLPLSLSPASPSQATADASPHAAICRVDHTIDAELSAALVATAQRLHLSLNVVMLGTWLLLLHRLGAGARLAIGITTAGRPAEVDAIERMVGLFITTVPLAMQVRRGQRVADWLRAVGAELIGVREHEHTPIARIAQWSGLGKAASLFEIVFVFENYPVDVPRTSDVDADAEANADAIEIEHVETHEITSVPCVLEVVPGPRMRLRGTCRTGASAEAIRTLLEQYERLLAGVVADPAQSIERVPLIDEETRRAWVVEWNQTSTTIEDAWVDERIAAQASVRPDAVAIECDGASVTYAALDRQATRVAQQLHALGVGCDSVVAVCLDPSIALVAGLLGVWKAGAAYLPLEPSDPPARLAFLVADSRAAVVLTGTTGAVAWPDSVRRLTIEHPLAVVDDATWQPPSRRAGDLAYVIYTSGSTGSPKGVLVTHGGLRNYVAWATTQYDVTPGTRTLLHTSVSFDLAVTSLWVPLAAGGTVVIGRGPAGAALIDALRHEHLGLVKLTPAHLALVEQSDVPHGAAVAVVGGEALSAATAHAWLRRAGSGARLYNEYGPTETVVGSSISEASHWAATGAAPIGRPIANTQMYVLDDGLTPVPVGVPGMLYIGGDGLARGYLRAPALTASRFVPDPFGGSGGRLYRTGDRACYRADGELEYFGRVDTQVKLRGYRIEPGEVEAVLQTHPAVAQAVVVPRVGASGSTQLVAYLVARAHGSDEPGAPPIGTIRAHAAARLPDHMVPTAWAWLDALPLTAHGKVDRARLPVPIAHTPDAVDRDRDTAAQATVFVGTVTSDAYVAPRTATERELAAIWREVLRVDPIGLHDNFFQLGGDSLRLFTVASLISHRLAVQLSIGVLYAHPTLHELSQVLEDPDSFVEERDTLLSLRRGTGPALFLAPPIAGSAEGYRHLASLMTSDMPVIGLQLPPLDRAGTDASTEGGTFAQLAAGLADRIVSAQPYGPYCIAGWSYGGFLAFELARALARDGRDVAFVGILDTVAPHYLPPPPDDDLMLLGMLAREHLIQHGRTVPLIDRDQTIGATLPDLLRVLKRAGVIPEATPVTWLRASLAGYRARVRLISTFARDRYDGPVTLIRADSFDAQGWDDDTWGQFRSEASYGWNAYASRPLAVETTPGTHATLISEPNAGPLAATLSACLATLDLHARLSS